MALPKSPAKRLRPRARPEPSAATPGSVWFRSTARPWPLRARLKSAVHRPRRRPPAFPGNQTRWSLNSRPEEPKAEVPVRSGAPNSQGTRPRDQDGALAVLSPSTGAQAPIRLHQQRQQDCPHAADADAASPVSWSSEKWHRSPASRTSFDIGTDSSRYCRSPANCRSQYWD